LSFDDSGEIFCIEFFEPIGDCDPQFERVGRMHDFDPGPGVDNYMHITIPENSVMTIAMQWNQPFGGAGPTTDHDIVLLDETGQTMTNLNRTAGSLNELIVQLRGDSRQLADRADRAVVAIETLVATLDTSVAETAADAQSLLAEMQGSAGAFTAMANEIQDMVAETRPPLRDFASGGLYELNTLLIEARALLAGLNRVTSEVERDPARFLFGDQQSGYEAGQP
jgi:hypothetical protein